MSNPIRVLVVDDSSVIRRVLTTIVESDPGLQVVGTASNGREALEAVERLKPEVMTLDIEMPELDGIGTLQELRKRGVRLPIVMFSTLTERGGRKTLEALSLGASDYVTKPDSAKNLQESTGRIKALLLPKLRALGERRRGIGGRRAPAPGAARPGAAPIAASPAAPSAAPPRAAAGARPAPAPPANRPAPGRVDAVMIGVSTGGPNALQDVIKSLSLDVPAAITQHMPPTFTRLLAERLDQLGRLEVLEAAEGMPMRPGRVLIAPGDHHLEFVRRGADVVARITQGPPENSCRPAVDVMLRSALDVWGPNVLTVIMTGMGHDGAAGAAALHARGGRVIAQDEASSVVWGMPGAIVQRGLADKVVPLPQLAHEIMSTVSVLNARGGRRSA